MDYSDITDIVSYLQNKVFKFHPTDIVKANIVCRTSTQMGSCTSSRSPSGSPQPRSRKPYKRPTLHTPTPSPSASPKKSVVAPSSKHLLLPQGQVSGTTLDPSMTSIAAKLASKNLRDALAAALGTTANGECDKEVVVSGQADGAGNRVAEKRAEGEGEGEDNGGKEIVCGEAGDAGGEKEAEDEGEGEDNGGKEIVGGEVEGDDDDGKEEVVGGEAREAEGEDSGGEEEGDDGEADGEEEPGSSKWKNGGQRKKIVVENDEPKRSTHSRTKAEIGPHRSGHKARDLDPAPATMRKRGLDNDAATSASKHCHQ
jgi:hypothetical protein